MVMSKQLPGPGEVFLDHTAFFVPAMDGAAAALEACGFRLTPFTIQTNREGDKTVPSGTGNRCAMLREGYIELLTATSETPLAAQLRERIADHVGIHLAAFSTADAAAEHRRLGEAGFSPLPLVDMRRPVGDDFARFSIARIAHGTMPEGRAQFLTHYSESLVWLPDMLDHPNGAEALTALWIAADDPAEAAARYAKFTGRPVKHHGPVTSIDLDRGWLGISTPAYLRESDGIVPKGSLPGFAAAWVRVGTLYDVEKCLDASGLDYHHFRDAAVIVNLPGSIGSALVFHIS
jgi:glyoxalase-like protein